MKIKRTHFVVFIVLWSGLCSYSQETNDSVPMLDILENVTDTYGYRFNYASATIADIRLHPPDSKWDIEEVLAYLTEKTGLEFSVLPNKFISIKLPTITLCGYLKDKDTQNSLSFATIQSSLESTISDENGYFEIAVAGKADLISIRFVGFKSLQREAGLFKLGSCGDVFMISQQLQLKEIVLYDYLIRGIDQLGDGSFQIDFNRFSILPGLTETDVLQSIQAFPGIHSVNETVSDINIRGGTNDQNLLLWDGIKMYQSGHFFGLISMFNPMITQNVSLRKNGTPAPYTDGVSGTISMETDDKLNKQFTGSLGLNFIDISGFIDTPLGRRSSLQVAARKAISDFVESPTYTEYFSRISQDTELENNAINVVNSDKTFDFYDTSMRWLWQPTEKDQLQLNFIHASNALVFNENADFSGSSLTRESSLNQSTIAGGLQYKRQWNDLLGTDFQVYNTDYELRAINANIQNNQRFLQENKVSETGVRVGIRYLLKEQLQWTNGYQFTETKVTNLDDVDNPIFKRLDGNVLRVHSGYTMLGYTSKNRNTNGNIGIRFNYLDKFRKQLWEPRLSFNQRFFKWFNIEVLGELKHQYTSQVINFQNDFLGIEKRRWQLSNEADIPVIISKQASVGLSFSNGGWLLNAVGFYKEIDGITAQSQGFQNQYEFVKAIGGYKANGIDLLVRKQFIGTSAWLSYSYLNADYHFKTLPENNFPSNYDITHAVTFGVSYELKQLRLAAGWNWRTGKPTTRPDAITPIVNDAVNFRLSNTDRFQDYMRVDISALYQFTTSPGSKALIGFSIWNVLDRENTISNYYRANGLGGTNEFLQNSLGITPNAVFRFSF